MNNRKTTLGRPTIHIPILKVLGYTVKVRHGSYGYKSNEDYKKFFEVIAPNTKDVDTKLPTKKYKKAKYDLWDKAIDNALALAHKEVEKNRNLGAKSFECIILPKYLKTSTRVKLYAN